MNESRRKVLIPSFKLTEECSVDDTCAQIRSLEVGLGHKPFTYGFKAAINLITEKKFEYNLVPVILDKNSAPWDVAAAFILDKLECDKEIATIKSLADDLGSFKEWLDCHEIQISC